MMIKLELKYKLIIISVVGLLLFFLITGIEKSINSKNDSFFDINSEIRLEDIKKIEVIVRYSDKIPTKSKMDISKNHWNAFVNTLIGISKLEKFSNRLLPTEIFECTIYFENKLFCFEVINSTTYGEVLAFSSGCFNGLHLGKVKNESDLLPIITSEF